jgi:WD40 repeat protein
MTGHDDRVLSVASDTQGRLCTSSLDKSVRLWSPQLSTKTADTGHNGSVTFVECIDNGSGLITGSR